jgi:hypothetical protein
MRPRVNDFIWSGGLLEAVHVAEGKVCLFVVLTMPPPARVVQLARVLKGTLSLRSRVVV